MYRQAFRLIVKETTGCKSRTQVHDEIIREFGISDKKRPFLDLFLSYKLKSTACGGIYERVLLKGPLKIKRSERLLERLRYIPVFAAVVGQVHVTTAEAQEVSVKTIAG